MTLNLEAADAYCRTLTRRHYENFSVASRFVDAAHAARSRAHLRVLPHHRRSRRRESATAPRCRAWSAGAPRSRRSSRARSRCIRCWSRCAETVERRAIPAQPFLDLIAANVQDQHVNAYRDLGRISIGYCRLSAAPVGRMVLRVFGVTDERGGAALRRRLHRAAAGQSRAGRQPRRRDRPALSRAIATSTPGGMAGRRASHGRAGARAARLGRSARAASSAAPLRAAARALPAWEAWRSATPSRRCGYKTER